MDAGLILVGLFLLLSGVILPWINFSRHSFLKKENDELKRKIKQIELAFIKKLPEQSSQTELDKHSQKVDHSYTNASSQQNITADTLDVSQSSEDVTQQETILNERLKVSVPQSSDLPNQQKNEIPVYADRKKTEATAQNFEWQFGARLPVWVGGIALSLAGYFLVKYTIDNNLLSPAARVFLGLVLGASLLLGSEWIRSRGFANGRRISQSLAGSGIVVLYAALLAATVLYELIPDLIGLLAMGTVSLIALVLSVRNGAAIAIIGMIGGFLSPALIGYGSHTAIMLFSYLLFVFVSSMLVCMYKQWWKVMSPAIGAVLVWVIAYNLTNYLPGDEIWIWVFLLGVIFTIVFTTRSAYTTIFHTEYYESYWSDPLTLNNIGGISAAIVLAGSIDVEISEATQDWVSFALFSFFIVALARREEQLYGFAAGVVLAVTLFRFYLDPVFVYVSDRYIDYTWAIFLYALAYTIAGYLFIWRSARPILWSALAVSACLGFYIIGYFKLEFEKDYAISSTLFKNVPHIWGGLALTLAAISAFAVNRVYAYYSEHKDKDHLLAIFAAAATAFISIALTIELEREFLTVAFAAQIFSLAWINSKLPIWSFRPLAAALAAGFGILLIPQILLLMQLTAYSLTETELYLQETVPIVAWPMFQLGLPALLFIGASYLFRSQTDGYLEKALEVASVALTAIMGYYLIRHVFHLDAEILFKKAGFFERGVITNLLFIFGLICFFVGKNFTRQTFAWCGALLCAIALFRIVYFDLLIYNPLWRQQTVPGVLLINALLLPFGLSALWAFVSSRGFAGLGFKNVSDYVKIFAVFLLFALITLNVRFFFQGTDLFVGNSVVSILDKGFAKNAEIYAYSLAWLLFGIGLLFVGTLKHIKEVRYASLIVMILTVLKVFLYDASELQNLYRVASFLGLGLSLLALSWFYSRFVFKTPDPVVESA